MNFDGLILGICAFGIIGIFHPIVIKTEYYWGTKFWWVFLVMGIIATVASLLISSSLLSSLFGVFAFTSFWAIKEIFEQKERVEKGWFPKRKSKK